MSANTPFPFYAKRTSRPIDISQWEVMAAFNILLGQITGAFKHDANEQTLRDAIMRFELALQDVIDARVHRNDHQACYQLLSKSLTDITAYCDNMAAGSEVIDQPSGSPTGG